ncbi:DUF6585 family protein [Streptomyces laculatispora]|uniref:DUF6585 family protein n=1 Tax=Streptomyces laculatispora TaxID=887464 RepID=UPI001A94EEE9|nr:DUF6585 family protein [Streptomyces laculatispora]MBO0915483.1 hypothetical protein [Streptomyces laculatispora]
MRRVARDFELGSRQELVWTEPKRFPWIVVLLPTLVGLPVLWMGISAAVEGQRSHGAWYYGLPLLILGTVLVAAAGYFLFLALTRRQAQVWVGHYQHGIVREVAGHVPEAYSWDEIDGIRRSSTKVTNGITSVTTHELWVRPREGAEITVTDAYKGVARFIDELDKTFTRVRLPQDRDRLKAGERVDFFGAHLDPAGVGYLDHRLGWREVDRVTVKQGWLEIHRHGEGKPWARLPVEMVQNLSVFLALAARMRQEAAGKRPRPDDPA